MTWFNVIVSNLGAFALGYLTCKWVAHRAAKAVDHHVHDHSEVTVNEKSASRLVRVAVFGVIGALMFGLGVRVGYQVLADKVACFNDYANKNADAQEPRSAATEALQTADAAQDLAIAAALSPGATRIDFARVRRATDAKIAKQAELAEQRQDNPYPDPPREVC